LLPPDTFLSHKNAFAADPAGGTYSTPPEPLARNGGGAHRKGEGKGEEGEGTGEERRGGEKGKGYPPNKNPGYGLAVNAKCNTLRCDIQSI